MAKKNMFIGCFLLISLAAFPCHASLKFLGKNESLTFDSTSFPPPMQVHWDIMKVRCIKCHTMERTVIAIRSGISPISGLPFNRSATKAYGLKMMRKPDSNMNKKEVAATVELMNWMLNEVTRKE